MNSRCYLSQTFLVLIPFVTFVVISPLTNNSCHSILRCHGNILKDWHFIFVCIQNIINPNLYYMSYWTCHPSHDIYLFILMSIKFSITLWTDVICYSGCVRLAVLDWLCYSGCVRLAVLDWLCYSGCVQLAVLDWLCYSGCVWLAVLDWLCYSGFIRLAVSDWLCYSVSVLV